MVVKYSNFPAEVFARSLFFGQVIANSLCLDALSALLIVIIFLLMVFTLSQFFLGEILSGRTQALERMNQKLAELSKVLSLEQKTNLSLSKEITQLNIDLKASTASREKMSVQLA